VCSSDLRKSFRSDPLAATFPASLSYGLGKIAEEIRAACPLGIGPTLISGIRESISSLEQKLRIRGELPAIEDAVTCHSEPALHALARLEEFFASGPTDSFYQHYAEALLSDLRRDLDGLRSLAQELDKTYSQDCLPSP